MTNLTLLHESTVDDSEIDTLGHMNVRYYGLRVAAASQNLFNRLGVNGHLAAGQIIRGIDTYNRFHREQFAGARLHTFGGLVTSPELSGGDGITAYFEVRNPDTGDLASTFIVTGNVIDSASQRQLGTPQPAQDLRDKYAVEVPEHGLPRSLSLAAPRHVSPSDLEQRIPVADSVGMMNGRREGSVAAEYCDENGLLREDVELMFVLHRPGGDQQELVGPPVLLDDEGRRYSWAIMETRSVICQRPKSGDVIVSMSVDVDFGEKWRRTRRWVLDKKTGVLFGVHDHVALCMDLDARRAIPMPEDVRKTVVETCVPEFG